MPQYTTNAGMKKKTKQNKNVCFLLPDKCEIKYKKDNATEHTKTVALHPNSQPRTMCPGKGMESKSYAAEAIYRHRPWEICARDYTCRLIGQ